MMDSTGRIINVGDRVRFRGQVYTIKEFKPDSGGRFNLTQILFEEPQHTDEIADELSVDLVQGAS